MSDTYQPARDGRRMSGSFSPREGDRYRDLGWNNDRGDRNRAMRRDGDRSRSRERRGPRDRDLDWNRRRPEKSRPPPRVDTGNRTTSAPVTPQLSGATAPSPLAMSPKVRQHISDQVPELLELFCDLVRSKAKMVDLEQILAGRKSDLARQHEKTPDFPSSWQAIQRGVASGERDFNKSSKEYQLQGERLRSVLTQLSNPMGDFVSNIVRDALPEHGTGTSSSNASVQKSADITSLETRLAQLQRQQQSTAAKTANELQALQSAMKAVTMEREELRERDQAMSRKEKAVDDLIADHRNLASEHQRLDERCARLETQNQKLSSENSRIERLLESNRKNYEELEKKTDRSRLDNEKLQEEVERARSELESIKEQSLSEDRHQEASSAVRSNFKTLSENHDKVVSKVSNAERTTTIGASVSKATGDIPIPEEALADITEKIRLINAEATAELTTDLKSVTDLVQNHQVLLNEFEPGELDKLWWTLPMIKEENDRLKEQVSALEKRHDELRTEIQNAKRGTSSTEAAEGTAASSPSRKLTPLAATDVSRHIRDSDAVRTAELAVKYDQLRKAQDGIIQCMGRMIDGVGSQVKSLEKSTGVEFVSVKERLDSLEKSASEGNQNAANTVDGEAPGKSEDVPRVDKDLIDTREKLQKLDNFVKCNFSDFSDRLVGLQQLYLDWQRQATNATNMPSPSNDALPHLHPAPSPGMVRQTSGSHEVKRPPNGEVNGSAKRRRMESPRHNRTSPATNGNGGH